MTKRKSTIDERLAAVKEYTEAGSLTNKLQEKEDSLIGRSMSGYENTVNWGIAGLEDRAWRAEDLSNSSFQGRRT